MKPSEQNVNVSETQLESSLSRAERYERMKGETLGGLMTEAKKNISSSVSQNALQAAFETATLGTERLFPSRGNKESLLSNNPSINEIILFVRHRSHRTLERFHSPDFIENPDMRRATKQAGHSKVLSEIMLSLEDSWHPLGKLVQKRASALQRESDGFDALKDFDFAIGVDNGLTERSAVEFALGSGFMEHFEKHGIGAKSTPKEMLGKRSLEHIIKATRDHATNFFHLMRHFRAWVLRPEVAIANQISAEGWKTMTETKDVTSKEWREQLLKKERKVPDKPLPEVDERDKKKLSESIGCEKYRQELEGLRNEGANVSTICAKEKEIFARVFSAVSRLPYGTHESDEERDPSYLIATPKNTAENRVMNCFTGPWLMASMLALCGIPRSQMFYCDVHRHDYGAFAGSHGSLMVTTSKKEILVYDISYGFPGQLMQARFCKGEKRKKFTSLLEGKADIAHVPIEPHIANRFQLPEDMHVMPVEDGVASHHMLHTGLQFFYEGKMAEAARALEIALVMYPEKAETSHYLGLIAFQKGDLVAAQQYFGWALYNDTRNQLSLFSLAEVHLALGDLPKARELLQMVAVEKTAIWGDKGGKIKRLVHRLLGMNDEELMAESKKRQPETKLPIASKD